MPYPDAVDGRQVSDAPAQGGLEHQAPELIVGLPEVEALREDAVVVLLRFRFLGRVLFPRCPVWHHPPAARSDRAVDGCAPFR
jgi:hypothetical protein